MKERGINNTFKKIIFESTEMVFLADDTYPYNIFYSNQIFENLIGQFLDERTLVGLGLDINSYIFNEELILHFMGVDYTFNLELPQENASNYFLFYKGKEMRGQGLPTKKDSQYFFRNTIDLIGIGQETYLTWVSNSIKNILGYTPEEMVNIELCSFFHPSDANLVRELIFDVRNERKNSHFIARVLHKSGEYKWLEFQVHFIVGKFYAMARDITETHKQLLDKESKNELFKLGEKVSKMGFWQINLPDQKISWSDEMFRIYETDVTELLGIDEVIKNFTSEYKSMMQQAFADLLATGKEFMHEVKIRTGKNSEKWVRVIGRSQFVEEKIGKIYGTVQDISATQEILESISLYKELFDLSPEIILISDIKGKLIYFNQEAKRRLDIEDKQTYSLGQFEKIMEDTEVWESHLGQLTAERSKIYPTTYTSRDGSEFYAEISASLTQIKGESYVISFVRDISGRVPLSVESKGSSNVLQHLTEQIPGALYQFVIDKEGDMKFSYLSPGIKAILDLEEEDLSSFNDISKAISKVHPEDMASVLTSTVASARKLSPWNCKFRLKTAQNDDFKWVLGTAKPEQLENGDVVWYGYLTDITEQKHFEENLKKAREEALRASQLKSEFLSIISHELRTPLNAISGSVYSLMQDQHTDSQKSAFETINFAVDNLISMINDLLDFQKMEASKLSLEILPMNLEEVLNQVLSGLNFHAKESGNQLYLKNNTDLNFEVRGDKVRLAQVLNNLVTNSLKFTKKGVVDVIVEIKENLHDKLKVYFEVKDNGIGIAKEDQARIFNEFDQIQNSFSKKYGGTGLGLSITKKLLAMMGSKIDFRSELGVGSSFFFEIEFEKTYLQPVPEVKEESEVVLRQQASRKPVELTDVNLLMAEDNDVNALVLGKILKKWGVRYKRVSNGKEAIEALKEEEFDCVLMDIQMPVMNGFEATEKIKEFSCVPVIALSAADKVEFLDKIEKIGFEGYVSKPIDASELQKKIKEVLMLSQSV